MEQFVAGFVIGSAISFLIAIGYYITTIDLTPVIAGQQWFIPSIGKIKVLKVLDNDLYFTDQGPEANVCFRYENLRIGYASKNDIKKIGVLLPQQDEYKEKYDEIEKILKDAQRLKKNLDDFDDNNIIHFVPKNNS